MEADLVGGWWGTWERSDPYSQGIRASLQGEEEEEEDMTEKRGRKREGGRCEIDRTTYAPRPQRLPIY